MRVAFAIVLCLSLFSAFAGSKSYVFDNKEVPAGWEASYFGTAYSSGALKLQDKTAFKTEEFPNAITSAVFQVKGHKGTDMYYTVFVNDKEFTVTTTTTTNCAVYFAPKQNYRSLEVTTAKVYGNVELSRLDVCWTDDGTVTPVPVIRELEDITSTGFSVSWNEVAEASGYEVRAFTTVSREESYRSVFFDEDFFEFSNDKGKSVLVEDFNSRMLNKGWTGENVYTHDVGHARLGNGDAYGWLLTPPIDLAGCEDVCLQFEAEPYGTYKVRTTLVYNGEETLLGDFDATKAERCNLMLPPVAGECQLRFQPFPARDIIFGMLTLRDGYVPASVETNSVTIQTQSTQCVFSGLETAQYQVQARALPDGEWSEPVVADLKTKQEPPELVAPSPQDVWIGESLSVTMQVNKTNGDKILSTSATGNAKGECSFSQSADGTWLFFYRPAPDDVGTQRFTLTCADKDGDTSVELRVYVHEATDGTIALASQGEYVQDFSQMTTWHFSRGSTQWLNGKLPLQGWYAWQGSEPVTNLTVGYVNAVGCYVPTNKLSFGSIAGNKKSICWGAVFRNATDGELDGFSLSFDVLQWKAVANTVDELKCQFCTTNTLAAFPDVPEEQWQTACVFTTPLRVTAAPVDYRETFTQELPVRLAKGQYLFLRWLDEDSTGQDNGLATTRAQLFWKTAKPLGTVVMLLAVP